MLTHGLVVVRQGMVSNKGTTFKTDDLFLKQYPATWGEIFWTVEVIAIVMLIAHVCLFCFT